VFATGSIIFSYKLPEASTTRSPIEIVSSSTSGATGVTVGVVAHTHVATSGMIVKVGLSTTCVIIRVGEARAALPGRGLKDDTDEGVSMVAE
jgi:hypothetical protein